MPLWVSVPITVFVVLAILGVLGLAIDRTAGD
jgi:hypothetical protein